ncbi:hypothetical protein FRB98_006060 [Tulasnella sp. 332]|nr:hypothetical protein FRB98_006060 [Tulasnella sp. 332]
MGLWRRLFAVTLVKHGSIVTVNRSGADGKIIARRFIFPPEDIRRLFEECELARGNIQMLGNALVFAKPEDALNGTAGVITARIEYHTAISRLHEG